MLRKSLTVCLRTVSIDNIFFRQEIPYDDAVTTFWPQESKRPDSSGLKFNINEFRLVPIASSLRHLLRDQWVCSLIFLRAKRIHDFSLSIRLLQSCLVHVRTSQRASYYKHLRNSTIFVRLDVVWLYTFIQIRNRMKLVIILFLSTNLLGTDDV